VPLTKSVTAKSSVGQAAVLWRFRSHSTLGSRPRVHRLADTMLNPCRGEAHGAGRAWVEVAEDEAIEISRPIEGKGTEQRMASPDEEIRLGSPPKTEYPFSQPDKESVEFYPGDR